MPTTKTKSKTQSKEKTMTEESAKQDIRAACDKFRENLSFFMVDPNSESEYPLPTKPKESLEFYIPNAAYRSNLSVVMANSFVRGKQEPLTVLEARLLRFAFSQVKENRTWAENSIIAFKASELIRFLGLPRSNIYRQLYTISNTLLKRTASVLVTGDDGKKGFRSFGLVRSCEYLNGIFSIRLSDELEPYIYGLNQIFTSYSFADTFKLQSFNEIRIYEYLCSYRNIQFSSTPKLTTPFGVELEKNEIYTKLSYLRCILYCEKKYPNNGDFCRYVLDPAIKAICKNTLMRVSYRKIKNGRVIEYIIFKFEDYTPQKEEKQCTNSESDLEDWLMP